MFKTKKTVLRGDFNIASCAGDKVDMGKARAIIRKNRDFLEKDETKIQTRKEEVRVAGWWRYRRKWKSYNDNGKLGKINPTTGRVEFVDGGYGFFDWDGKFQRTK